MPDDYTHRNLLEVDDAAARSGFGETQEARFANAALESEQTGLSHHRVRPGKRQSFGHRHDDAEEIYVVLSGAGRVKLDDEIVELTERDAIRVAPGITRCFEAGDGGLEVLAFGPLRPDDRGEIIPGWWKD
jgi:mannose-6-phosphate isomerase-like protein (cupin superfamily)